MNKVKRSANIPSEYEIRTTYDCPIEKKCEFVKELNLSNEYRVSILYTDDDKSAVATVFRSEKGKSEVMSMRMTKQFDTAINKKEFDEVCANWINYFNKEMNL